MRRWIIRRWFAKEIKQAFVAGARWYRAFPPDSAWPNAESAAERYIRKGG
jgi:hypothetical protein